MRLGVKFCINVDEVDEAKFLRHQALLFNQHNPYAKIDVPELAEKIYRTTEMGVKLHSAINYYVEPTKDKDIIINISQLGEVRATYDPLVESKLEMWFHGE